MKADKSEAVPTDFQVKHPLQDSWTWWFDTQTKKSTQISWGANLKKIYSFATVEDFWSLWNNIKGAHELQPGSDYHVFKCAPSPLLALTQQGGHQPHVGGQAQQVRRQVGPRP